ncbi:nucleoside recognition protein [Geothermobacter ehrlichii]|uniref:Nucleoside recognition protein n=1 Tax=Geothermobacter ehrlichii TaxID=213224 RepID=A0A5D3WNW4_9BACT|nr:nucleoside recognition domain-containing protein [Geothermobacter ehrlichii]TYO99886.1 nucleoside recognition protein [Geothermobacter ehrlichii]
MSGVSAPAGGFRQQVSSLLKDSVALYWELVRIMVPVMLLIRVAVLLGVIEVCGRLIDPLMSWVGLPGAMGVVWVTGIFVNIYGGAAALISLLPDHPLTVAQATVLGSMLLVAHAIPLEGRIAQKSGAGLVFICLFRLGVALAYGFLLTRLYAAFDLLTEPATILFAPANAPVTDWGSWLLASLRSLLSIFWIILALLTTLKLLDLCRITPLIARCMAPLLRLMGISDRGGSMTMAGLLLGLSYGGGLIIRESRAGNLPETDIFLALCFMSICHSLIEDTLFVMAMGAHVTGVLFGRFLFSLLVMALLARLVHGMSEKTFHAWLFRPSKS